MGVQRATGIKLPRGRRGFTERQRYVLSALYAHEKLSLQMLSKEIGCDEVGGEQKALASLKGLIKKGLVVKEDERRVYRLTKMGVERYENG